MTMRFASYFFAKIFQQPAAAAKSLQSCLTLCDPIHGSPLEKMTFLQFGVVNIQNSLVYQFFLMVGFK